MRPAALTPNIGWNILRFEVIHENPQSLQGLQLRPINTRDRMVGSRVVVGRGIVHSAGCLCGDAHGRPAGVSEWGWQPVTNSHLGEDPGEVVASQLQTAHVSVRAAPDAVPRAVRAVARPASGVGPVGPVCALENTEQGRPLLGVGARTRLSGRNSDDGKCKAGCQTAQPHHGGVWSGGGDSRRLRWVVRNRVEAPSLIP